MDNLTIAQIHQGLSKKEFSAVEIANKFLAEIEKKDKGISAYISVTRDLALWQARKVDEMISTSRNFPVLAGVPLAIKDNILVEGKKNTCASRILENYIAPYDAACVKKLKSLGAVILGKTNLDEFAMGGSTENSGFFTTKNPKDSERVPGGSSGGSAAAVAANMAAYALGSDTGGSIRQPASFCGVVGLKPTYGAVSRCGLVAFASSLDQIGPLTKTADDAEIVFEAISGKDKMDSTSVEMQKNKDAEIDAKKLRIGIPKEYFIKGIDAQVEKIIRNAIKKYEDMGAKIEEISLPHTKYALPTYYLVATSEASANLARFDGIKYGFSSAMRDGGDGGEIQNLLDVYLKSRARGFGAEVKRRIMLGTYALSAGYYDAYYLKAQKVRRLIKDDFDKAFQKVDVIFTPVSPTPAFKIGEKISDPLSMYLADIFTVSVNLAGLPAVSIPAGFSENLPVGLQIIGRPFRENQILKVGKLL